MSERFEHYYSGFPDAEIAEAWAIEREKFMESLIDKTKFKISYKIDVDRATGGFFATVRAESL